MNMACVLYCRDAQLVAHGPERARKRLISSPCSKLICTRNFSWMMTILWNNLSFIELLRILQLITIRNTYYVFARWQQYQTTGNKKTSKVYFFRFLILDFQKFRSLFCLWPSSALKILCCSLWPKKVVHLCYIASCPLLLVLCSSAVTKRTSFLVLHILLPPDNRPASASETFVSSTLQRKHFLVIFYVLAVYIMRDNEVQHFWDSYKVLFRRSIYIHRNVSKL